MPHQLSNGHAAARQPAPLRTSLRALFRHKKKALLWFVVTVGGAGLWTAYGPKTYRSDSKLFVRLGRESVTLDPTATTGQVVSITESRESEMNSIYEMLHNRELYVAVALEVGPEEILGLPEPAPEATPVDAGGVNTETAAVEAGAWGKMADWGRNAFQSFVESLRGMNGATEEAKLLDGAVRKLENSLHLAAVRKSSIVSVACDARTPQLAQRINQALIDRYLEQHARMNRIQGSHDFFTEQTKFLSDDLRRREEELRDLKNQISIGSMDLQRELLLRRLGDTEVALRETEAQISSSEAHVTSIREQLSDLPSMLIKEETTGHANAAADEMRNQLYALQLKEAELLTTYQEDYYLVQNIRRQIAEAKAILEQESDPRTQTTRATNRLHEELQLSLLTAQTELSRQRAMAGALSDQLVAGRKELEQLNGNAVRLTEMQRELELADAKYRKYADNLEQARIDQALETNRISNINVVQSPSLALKPVKPEKLMNMALALVIGTLGALVLALTAEQLDTTIGTPEAAEEAAGAPALAEVPHSRELIRTLVARGKQHV